MPIRTHSLLLPFLLVLMGTRHPFAVAQEREKKSDVYVVGVLGPAHLPKDGDGDPCTNPGKVTVTIGRTARPVVLVLSNSQCTQWVVKRGRESSLRRIVAASADLASESPNFRLQILNYEGYNDGPGVSVLRLGDPISIYPFQRSALIPPNDPRCQAMERDVDCTSRLNLFKEQLSGRYGFKRIKAFFGAPFGREFKIGD